MAKFRFKGLGDVQNVGVETMGVPIEFRFRRTNGTKSVHKPKDAQGAAKAKFDVGDEIEETDERAVRHLRADPRFEEVQ